MYTLNKEAKMRYDFLTPDHAEQNAILAYIRTLSMDEAEALYAQLVAGEAIGGPQPEAANQIRRLQRYELYRKEVTAVCAPYLQALDPAHRLLDIGCGDGEITMAVFNELRMRGAELYGCDVVDYLTSYAKESIRFEEGEGIVYLRHHTDNTFDCVMEIVALHHLPSKELYREYVREMIRVTRPGGLIIFVETVHTTWADHLRNALLDIVLNDRTSRHITGSSERAIPVPIQFLSEDELREEIEHSAHILKVAMMKQTPADPKRHAVYICQK